MQFQNQIRRIIENFKSFDVKIGNRFGISAVKFHSDEQSLNTDASPMILCEIVI